MARVKRIEQLPEPSPAEVEPVEHPKEVKTLQIIHDVDSNTVTFPLNGIEVTLREPKGKDFLLMESWIRQAKGEMQDPQIALIKLAQLCVVEYGNQSSVSFDEFFDNLEEIEDIERVVSALGFFRDKLDAYAARITAQSGV